MNLTNGAAELQWGGKAAPLLPESLRLAWKGELIPRPVSESAGLDQWGSPTLDQLNSAAWKKGLIMTSRLERYLVSLVGHRRAKIEGLPILMRRWPPALAPGDVPWEKRIRNALINGGAMSVDALSGFTFGDLFLIRGLGAKSALVLTCTLEASVASLENVEIPDALELPEILRGPWAEQVSGADPRFSKWMHQGSETLDEYIEALDGSAPPPTQAGLANVVRFWPEIAATMDEIAQKPLDESLREFVQAVTRLEGERLRALLARLGFDGVPPKTLQAAGDILGVSRERIRQIEASFRDKIPSHAAFMPSLDCAIDLLGESAPLEVGQASDLLQQKGLSSTPFHPRSVLAAAREFGRPETFRVEKLSIGERIVTSSEAAAYARRVVSLAARQASSIGASNVAEVSAGLEDEGLQIEEDEVREILGHHSDASFLDADWFWMPDRPQDRNRLRNVARRVLSVVSPQDVASLREGARRVYRQRGLVTTPPRSVMLSFFRAHPEFRTRDNDRVEHKNPLDYRQELGSTDQVLVDVLRSTPSGVLDRSSFETAAIARGMNPHTFNVYATYSPVIDHLGTDIWCLRGTHVDPAAVEALRRANAQRTRERRVEDFGWTAHARLKLILRLPRMSGSVVAGIPAAISKYVADRRFSAFAEDGSAVGTVAVDQKGTSWGYGPFLRRRGADEGDLLRVEFDLVEESVHLSLEGDDLP